MSDERVNVRGIRELSAAFRKVDAEIGQELKDAFMAVAARVVAIAQQRMPHKSGAAMASVKPRASQKGAGIAFGGTKAPYMPWLDFGGSVGRGHKPGVAWSGAIGRDWLGKPGGDGRYVYPAISEARDDTEAATYAAMEKACRSAGFDWSDR